jgi:hypothetical protein
VDAFVVCPSCNTKLAVPTEKARPKGICPRCQTVLRVVLPGSVATLPRPHSAEREEVRASQQVAGAPAVPENGHPSSAYDLAPAKVAGEPEFVEPIDESPAAVRKRKRKKGQLETAKAPGNRAWLFWTIGVGVLAFVALAVAVTLIATGHGALVIFYAIAMTILMPISLVILIVSMFASSAIVGGIDFGPAITAIPKAIFLLIIVNSVSLIPFAGGFLTLPIWIIGLMGFFGLDIWETRMLIVINWLLNLLAKALLFFIILNALTNMLPGDATRSKKGFDAKVPPAIAVPQEDE